MIIHFQSILFLKQFIACNGCFGLFTKLEKGSGTSFCTHFLNTPSLGKVSMSHLFSFSRFQTKNKKLKICLGSWSQRLTEKKRGEGANTKIWTTWEQKEIFRWNKKHFWQLFKGYHLVKKWKIADTSFKLFFNQSIA